MKQVGKYKNKSCFDHRLYILNEKRKRTEGIVE
jgi:hypothetical protein